MNSHYSVCCFSAAWWAGGRFPLASMPAVGWSLPWLSCLNSRFPLSLWYLLEFKLLTSLLGGCMEARPGKASLDPSQKA